MNLRQAYEAYHRSPQHRERTTQEYMTALNHWERITDNPDILAIDSATLERYVSELLSQPLPVTRKLASPFTVRKLLRAINAILATLAPARPGSPYGLGLIPKQPVCRPPKCHRADDATIISPAEITAILQSCRQETSWPPPAVSGVPVPDWWAGLFVFLLSVGARRNEFLHISYSDMNLTAGVVRITPLKHGRFPVKSLHTEALPYLIRMAGQPRRLWFQCPATHDLLYGRWYAIQERAGIRVARPVGSTRQPYYGFHEVRKTCGTRLMAVSPALAQQTLSHCDLRTTIDHYTNFTQIGADLTSKTPLLPTPPPDSTDDEPYILRIRSHF